MGQGGHKRLYTRGACRGGREPFVGFLSATATCIAKTKDDDHCGDHMHLLLQFRCPRPENSPRKPVEGVHEAFEAEQPLVSVRLLGDVSMYAEGILVHDQCGWWTPPGDGNQNAEVAP